MSFKVTCAGPWAGYAGDRVALFAGTLNQTGLSDDEASTFDSVEAAQAAVDDADEAGLLDGAVDITIAEVAL